MRRRTGLPLIPWPSRLPSVLMLLALVCGSGGPAEAASLIDDLPSALAEASSRMPDECRRDIALIVHDLYAALDQLPGGVPLAAVSRDSLHSAIKPLSRYYPDGEKLLYYGVLVAVDRYDGVCRALDGALADSLATARTRVRLASREPTDNAHVNKYVMMLAARLAHLHDLLHAMLVQVGVEPHCQGVELPALDDAEDIDQACGAIEAHLAVLCQAAERLVASWPR